jgi:hypothetical protein
MNKPTSYIVSLVYHKIGDDTYEILEEKYIDFRGVHEYDDICDDISCYHEDWITSVKGTRLKYGVVYKSIFAVNTEYSRDYWGEVDRDIDWEVLSHQGYGCVVEYINTNKNFNTAENLDFSVELTPQHQF